MYPIALCYMDIVTAMPVTCYPIRDFTEPPLNRFTRRKSVFAEAYDPEEDDDDGERYNQPTCHKLGEFPIVFRYTMFIIESPTIVVVVLASHNVVTGITGAERHTLRGYRRVKGTQVRITNAI
ncbi:hypothetical protein SK128_017290 [Halocaridina rubra]|uniref:Uncharacterized protein n=1 Tax=Halocaridina rubra TaxID=373956 RepID=A0AAN8ZT55_HALRR